MVITASLSASECQTPCDSSFVICFQAFNSMHVPVHAPAASPRAVCDIIAGAAGLSAQKVY